MHYYQLGQEFSFIAMLCVMIGLHGLTTPWAWRTRSFQALVAATGFCALLGLGLTFWHWHALAQKAAPNEGWSNLSNLILPVVLMLDAIIGRLNPSVRGNTLYRFPVSHKSQRRWLAAGTCACALAATGLLWTAQAYAFGGGVLAFAMGGVHLILHGAGIWEIDERGIYHAYTRQVEPWHTCKGFEWRDSLLIIRRSNAYPDLGIVAPRTPEIEHLLLTHGVAAYQSLG